MKIVSLVLNGSFTDGMAYQENCLPYYQQKVFGADVVIITGQYSLIKGSNKSVLLPPGHYQCNNGIPLIRIKSIPGKIGKKLAYLPTLYEELEKQRPDYIFVHLLQSLSTLDVIKYKMKHPEVIIYGDSHADYINSAHGWFSKKVLHGLLWKGIIQISSKSFEKIYGVLPARVEFLKEMYGLNNKKVALLLMGAEDDLIDYEHHNEIRAYLRERLNIKPDDFVVVTGGKIDEKKNLPVLINAIDAICDKKIKLLLFGKPDEKMKAYVNNLKNKSYLRYLDWLEPKAMYNYFHVADLCVFPGTHSVIWEQAVGFGLPGIFRHWGGIEHINCGGNIKFFYNKAENELEQLLKEVVFASNVFCEMKKRAEEVKTDFHYSNLAVQSLGGCGMNDCNKV